jgi:hypothetical protein
MTDQNTVAPGAETSAELSNDKRKSELFKQVTKFGEEASLGRDSLPKLAHAVVKAAADGIIDAETKNANGDDAATELYERYAKAESKKAIHEHSSGGKKANISKLRQLINLGAMTTVDGFEVMQDAFQARENMIADDNKVKSAYPFYVDVAREQLKSDKKLDQSTLEGLAMKDAPAAPELETVLKGIMKKLEGLTTDGLGKEKLKDQDALTIAAFEAIRERLDNIATLRQREKLMKDAAALGLKIA